MYLDSGHPDTRPTPPQQLPRLSRPDRSVEPVIHAGAEHAVSDPLIEPRPRGSTLPVLGGARAGKSVVLGRIREACVCVKRTGPKCRPVGTTFGAHGRGCMRVVVEADSDRRRVHIRRENKGVLDGKANGPEVAARLGPYRQLRALAASEARETPRPVREFLCSGIPRQSRCQKDDNHRRRRLSGHLSDHQIRSRVQHASASHEELEDPSRLPPQERRRPSHRLRIARLCNLALAR